MIIFGLKLTCQYDNSEQKSKLLGIYLILFTISKVKNCSLIAAVPSFGFLICWRSIIVLMSKKECNILSSKSEI